MSGIESKSYCGKRHRRGIFVENAPAMKHKLRKSGIADGRRTEYVAPTELCITPERVSTNITLLWSVFPCAHIVGSIVEPRWFVVVASGIRSSSSRSDVLHVAVDFSPWWGIHKETRRGATLEPAGLSKNQSSLRDEWHAPAIPPWTQVHGYTHLIAPQWTSCRRTDSGKIERFGNCGPLEYVTPAPGCL